jgi:glycerate 2-kinase
MRIVVAPQEFKGSLTAIDAARAIAAGMHSALPDAEIVEAPMSDGGPGLVDALLSAVGGERVETEVHDPLMRPVRAAWAILGNAEPRTAAIEMAAASGLVLLRADERDPLAATTHGTGELMRAAMDRGCRRITVGVGGSATMDGGAGALQALGVRLLDSAGNDLPLGGGSLAMLDHIDLSGRDARLAATEVRVASDVTNSLCGDAGAAVMFGPQKGASPDDVRVLEDALHHFAEIVRQDCGVDVLTLRGGGAAGGLAAGLAAGAGASIEPGFTIVAEAVGLEAKIAEADLVVTGEGRLDTQTDYGKTVSGVAGLARAHGKQVAVIAGSVDGGYDPASGAFDFVESIVRPGTALEEAMRDGAALVAWAAERLARRFAEG